ncbi:MAG: hypothetical protein J7559_19090 [Cohnella sp.]|nr:hypothetical protein [Cohnella sp.]
MSQLSFAYYTQIESPETERLFREEMNVSGYFAFYAFAEQFREGLRLYDETQIELYGRLLERSRGLFPEPARFSPSFDELWDEFEGIYRAKNEAIAAIPVSERNGEWQVLIDNPYSTQQVVCYPGLSFIEAAYLYGYFQRELKPNELLRLQRITHCISVRGSKEQSFFPSTS